MGVENIIFQSEIGSELGEPTLGTRGNFLRLDRNRKPRMKSLSHTGYGEPGGTLQPQIPGNTFPDN